jgi:putative transposase
LAVLPPSQVFRFSKLAEAAEKSWRRLDGHNQLPKVILGVTFTDGIEATRQEAQAAAA